MFFRLESAAKQKRTDDGAGGNYSVQFLACILSGLKTETS